MVISFLSLNTLKLAKVLNKITKYKWLLQYVIVCEDMKIHNSLSLHLCNETI